MSDTSHPLPKGELLYLLPYMAACKHIGMHPQTALRYLKRGQVPRTRLKSAYFVQFKDLFQVFKLYAAKKGLDYKELANEVINKFVTNDVIKETVMKDI